jgi:hypothetical protein
MAKRQHVSHGRSKAKRGSDKFDTPATALAPLFVQEPLLADVTAVCEPFCGCGNLVVAMRLYGLTVYASDIEDRGCPGSELLDFLKMTHRPAGCDVLVSNPPYAGVMGLIEHAFALGFRVIALLLKTDFPNTEERYQRLHKPGHLRRVYILAERLQGMHDAAHLAAGGKKASQSQTHNWYVFDRNYRGPSTNIAVSIKRPTERMPWASGLRQADVVAEAAE